MTVRRPRLSRRLAALCLAALAAPVSAEGPSSSGSGFFVNAAGWLVTNAHVVADCARLEIPGHRNPRPIFIDTENDLAAVLVEPGGAVAPLSFRSTAPRLAEPVAAIGFPLADVLSESVRVTTGTVSSITGIGGDPRYIQVSAPVQPGNSGGPVIDRAGLVVGVASATLSDAAYARAQNVNFALSAEMTLRFLGVHGIAAATTAPTAGSGDLSLAAEAGARGTVPVRCYGSVPPATGGATVSRPSGGAEMAGLSVLGGVDVIGFDYHSLRNVDLPTCARICGNDRRCAAFTYNTRYAHCFLKDDSALTVLNEDATSGIRPWRLNDLIQTRFRVFANRDSVGGDYLRIRQSDFIPCFLECASDDRCRGFAYVRRTRDCWLKDRVGYLQRMDGVEFGMK